MERVEDGPKCDVGWDLQWVGDPLLASASEGGPYHREVEGWDEPS